jgi:hypothetical protein
LFEVIEQGLIHDSMTVANNARLYEGTVETRIDLVNRCTQHGVQKSLGKGRLGEHFGHEPFAFRMLEGFFENLPVLRSGLGQ